MSLKNLPVGSLTHLHIAFGYIAPDTFDISMMDGVPDSVIDKITQLKDNNPAINMAISLGGWSFSDNDTTTQPVFGDMVSSKANLVTFITNLFAFLDHYGFDGVDFDWEYPGASDRGGNDDDSPNYATFLKKLDQVNLARAKKAIVSFSAPTSYRYLQYMPLTDMMDYVNLMAYDLHGTWDGPQGQVGSIVLAHTNLTEIQNALSFMWRNDVDPFQINLGIGFFGRSFNLADPNCFQPGCPFQGGAAKGVCSGESMGGGSSRTMKSPTSWPSTTSTTSGTRTLQSSTCSGAAPAGSATTTRTRSSRSSSTPTTRAWAIC